MGVLDNDPKDSTATDLSAEPALVPGAKKPHKPVLHIGTEGERLEEDGLEIDDEELPVFGSDKLHT